MSQETVDLVRLSLNAFNRRDLDTLEALNHPEVEVDWSASRGLHAGVYRGWEEVRGFYNTFLEIFQEVKLDPERFMDYGESVVVPNLAQFRGRDGIETTAQSALVFQLRGGRIVRICLYQDTPEALKAAGIAE